MRTQASSPSLAASPGKARSPAGTGLVPRSPATSAKTAVTTTMAVAQSRRRKPRFCIWLALRQRQLGLAPPAATQAQGAEHDCRRRDQDRHQRDVAEFENCLQPLDILAQRR